MEAAPPSYEMATLTDYWDIIARYVPSNELCSCALVCSRWHTIFAPHLWGNPASHWTTEHDRVYVALTKFKRTLQTARLLVRSLTHTLHLPPAHAEIYSGPHADWLRDILERLPNLQTLIVRGLPFFDHSALQALRFAKPKRRQSSLPDGVVELPGSNGLAFERPTAIMPAFGLRLLDASRCSNVTSNGLAHALTRFDALIYLDLSFTYPARDTVVLSTLHCLTGLQVLKLRGISLSDESIEVLAKSVCLRVRSLDVRDNFITDRGVRMLLDNCFSSSDTVPSGARSPALLPYLGTEMLGIYQGEDYEGYLRNAFTGNFVSRLATEDVPEGGITHLYIAGNRLTVEGASGLVRSGRLHVLDLASVEGALSRHRSRSSQGSSDMDMPGVEKLTPILFKHASEGLTCLRIEHSLVTKDAPGQPQEEVIRGRIELADTSLPPLPNGAVELEATTAPHEVYEMPTEMTPRFELAGDPMRFLVHPPINDPPHFEEDDADLSYTGRRGSAFAPEVVQTDSSSLDHESRSSPVSAVDGSTMSGSTWSTMTPLSPMMANALPVPSPAPAPNGARPRTYSSVATERKARLTAHTLKCHNLHPAMLPHLTTLLLTDVPPFSPTTEITDRLIAFIKQCAAETNFARAQAKLDYALPPGRKGHASALKHSQDEIFALKRIVLELAPEQDIDSRKTKATPWQSTSTRSMTEDRDSEALWSAAETDFSFFGEGDECDFPSLERGCFAHTCEKEVSFGNDSASESPMGPSVALLEPKYDTVALLSAFRKDRKLAHQRNVIAGAAECVETEGYWDGVVQVVRPSTGLRPDEELDCYGNVQSGGIYR